MIRLAWLLVYGALCALAFVVDKAKDYAAEKVAPSPPTETP